MRLAFLLLLSACQTRTYLPVEMEKVEVRLSTEQLVCHVRSIADAQKLSFHYGTSEQSYGSLATFRLIGDGIELTLVNPERAHTFDLRAYDKTSGGTRAVPARRAFAAFRTALRGPISPACTN